MSDENLNVLTDLIRDGLLAIDQELSCPEKGVVAKIAPQGIAIDGRVFNDPTLAMRHARGVASASDNGWTFWKVPDQGRGFVKPLEHVRIEWLARHDNSGLRTSQTHPLRIDTLTVGAFPGKIGLTFLPGKKGDAFYGAPWDRNLEVDLARINQWGADAVVSLLEYHEFDLLGVPQFPEVMMRQPFRWFHLEVRDSDIPDQRFENEWPQVRPALVDILRRGGGVVVHCRGGLGRTGLVVARLLVELGVGPEEAIAQVRAVRKGAIETWEQEEYVRMLAPAS